MDCHLMTPQIWHEHPSKSFQGPNQQGHIYVKGNSVKFPQSIQRFIVKICRLPNSAIIVWFSRKLYSFTACCAYMISGKQYVEGFFVFEHKTSLSEINIWIHLLWGWDGWCTIHWMTRKVLVVVFIHWVTLSKLWTTWPWGPFLESPENVSGPKRHS